MYMHLKINQKIPRTNSEYNRVATQKVNTQKFIALPYGNEQVEFKL